MQALSIHILQFLLFSLLNLRVQAEDSTRKCIDAWPIFSAICSHRFPWAFLRHPQRTISTRSCPSGGLFVRIERLTVCAIASHAFPSFPDSLATFAGNRASAGCNYPAPFAVDHPSVWCTIGDVLGKPSSSCPFWFCHTRLLL